jgi:hypothetical protein
VDSCQVPEKASQWNQTGPQGPQGPQGQQGPQGPQGPAGSGHAYFATNFLEIKNPVGVSAFTEIGGLRGLPAGNYLFTVTITNAPPVPGSTPIPQTDMGCAISLSGLFFFQLNPNASVVVHPGATFTDVEASAVPDNGSVIVSCDPGAGTAIAALHITALQVGAIN